MTLENGDAVDVVARLKAESEAPLRSHGSLSMNRALLDAGLVDLVQVTVFPVITGQTGVEPVFQGAADFDLELIESRTLDGHIQGSSTDPPSIDRREQDRRVTTQRPQRSTRSQGHSVASQRATASASGTSRLDLSARTQDCTVTSHSSEAEGYR